MSRLHHDTPHHDRLTAAWPPDGTAAARLAQADERRNGAAYNDRARRLDILGKAVADREGDLAQAQRTPGAAGGGGALLQMAGRLHRARLELAELLASPARRPKE
jgi:hypothetical protein